MPRSSGRGLSIRGVFLQYPNFDAVYLLTFILDNLTSIYLWQLRKPKPEFSGGSAIVSYKTKSYLCEFFLHSHEPLVNVRLQCLNSCVGAHFLPQDYYAFISKHQRVFPSVFSTVSYLFISNSCPPWEFYSHIFCYESLTNHEWITIEL